MRHNERAVYILHPSLSFSSDFNFSCSWNSTAAARDAAEAEAARLRPPPPTFPALKPHVPLQQQEREKLLMDKLQEMRRRYTELTQRFDPSDVVTLTANDWLM